LTVKNTEDKKKNLRILRETTPGSIIVQTVRLGRVVPLAYLHNFWIERHDKTTAAERLCGFKPTDLFEYIIKHMRPIPLPRQRNQNTTSPFNSFSQVAA
jgi:hypothetical protein